MKDWLERSAGIFRTILPGGQDQPLLDADFPSYNFDVMAGVTYRIDPSQPPRFDGDGALLNADASRIVDLAHQGHPVAAGAEFLVATNSYRAAGGGAFPGATYENVVYQDTDTNRDILLRHVAERGVADHAMVPNWSLAPLPGTSALFDTGPGAIAHAGGVTGVNLELVSALAPNGFVRFRLRL